MDKVWGSMYPSYPNRKRALPAPEWAVYDISMARNHDNWWRDQEAAMSENVHINIRACFCLLYRKKIPNGKWKVEGMTQ